ncbi:hypothetical protein QTN25_008556 [Entamoeba marina]
MVEVEIEFNDNKKLIVEELNTTLNHILECSINELIAEIKNKYQIMNDIILNFQTIDITIYPYSRFLTYTFDYFYKLHHLESPFVIKIFDTNKNFQETLLHLQSFNNDNSK